MYIGEAFVGEIPDNAHPNLVIARREVLFPIVAQSLAQPTRDHVSFMTVLRPGVLVKPDTLFVSKVATTTPELSRMVWGPAQAGVAQGVHDCALAGDFPGDPADWMVIAAVWVNARARDDHAVEANNRSATAAAIRDAFSGGSAEARTAAAAAVDNPFMAHPATGTPAP